MHHLRQAVPILRPFDLFRRLPRRVPPPGQDNNPRQDRICEVCGKTFHFGKKRRTCSRVCMRVLENWNKLAQYPAAETAMATDF